MVKNTGSHSAASIGYAAEQTMISTVSSGIVATGAYLEKTAPAVVLGKLDSVSRTPYILGKNKDMEKLSNTQFFSSRLLDCYFYKEKNIAIATFEVSSGNKKNGKALKTARVLYRFEGVEETEPEEEEEEEEPPAANAQNAVFSKGRLNDGNAAINVENGPATFLNAVTFQNYNSIFRQRAYFGGTVTFSGNKTVTFYNVAYFQNTATFGGVAAFNDMAYFGENSNATFAASATFTSAYFKKDADFNGTAAFTDVAYFGSNSNATFSKSATFDSDAYFGKKAYFKDNTVTFNRRVGFDSQIETNITMHAPNDYDVYMNANFTSTSNGKLQGAQCPALTTQEVFYSQNFTGVFANWFQCITQHNQVSNNMKAFDKLLALNSKINPPTPPAATDLTDPELDINLITKAETAGKVTIHKAHEIFGTTFSLSTLRTKYNSTPTNKRYDKKYLVIEVTSPLTFSTPPADNTFNGDVIFIVKSGGVLSVNCNFYISGANSSTLIYVGSGNARLDNFGSNGLFRGFIYIDAGNTVNSTPYNTIKFGPQGSILGAVHNFSSYLLGWNGGESDQVILVKFAPAVLSGFKCLYNDCSKEDDKDGGGNGGGGGGGGTHMTLKPEAGGKLRVTPLGYYFY